MFNFTRKNKSIISSAGPLISRNANAKFRATKGKKISGVVLEFGSDYLPHSDDEPTYREYFARCVIAWNLSFLNEDERQSSLIGVSSSYESSVRAEIIADLIVLIDRKLLLFGDDDRFIHDYELSFSNKDVSLSVASYPFGKKR
jgi:hypothetical protein